MWAAVEHAPDRHSAAWPRAAKIYHRAPQGSSIFSPSCPSGSGSSPRADLRLLLVFRIVRFLKLARYSPAMRSLIEVLYNERRALFGCVVILIGTTLVTASLMYLAERHVQPDKLGTIPDAMWWAIVTLGTIGYGDIVPVTVVGKLIAAVTIFCGLVMVALPVGIIATAFCRDDPPARFRRDLGHDRQGAAVFRARGGRHRRHHAAVCARRPWRLAPSSRGAAIRRIRCISLPRAKWRSP